MLGPQATLRMAVITVAIVNTQKDIFFFFFFKDIFIEENSRRRRHIEACCIPRGDFVSKGGRVESEFALRPRGQKALCSIRLFP